MQDVWNQQAKFSLTIGNAKIQGCLSKVKTMNSRRLLQICETSH